MIFDKIVGSLTHCPSSCRYAVWCVVLS